MNTSLKVTRHFADKAYSLYLAILLFVLSACGGGTSDQDPAQSNSDSTTQPVSNSAPTGKVSISGTVSLGNVVTVEQNLQDNNGLGNFNYQWYRDGQAISNGSNNHYTISQQDLGLTLTVTVSYTDGDGFAESINSAAFFVAAADINNVTTNILLIIADDQGLDASNQYPYSNDRPVTPHLDSLAEQGIIFENAWVTPACTTTRATLLTGKHGINSGVTYVPAPLDSSSQTLAKYIKNHNNSYQTAAFGKWHLAGGASSDANHPNDSGFDYYAGNLGNIDDYYHWQLTINGEQSYSQEYHSSKITDLALSWIQQQNNPWFVWLAYSAPHSPFHLPPAELHQRTELSGDSTEINADPRDYYLAAIEAMDSEIGRLINSLDPQVLANTIIFYLGDNGTPSRVIDTSVYQQSHAKGSLYQGGIRVPMLVSGKGVERQGAREEALVNGSDFYATIGQIAGISSEQIYDSSSFVKLLSSDNSPPTRSYNYTEFDSDNVSGWTIADQQLKLIQFADDSQQLFAINTELDESEDLSENHSYASDIARLTNLALTVRGETNSSALDITNQIFLNRSGNCQDYAENYQSTVMDVNNSRLFSGDLTITLNNGKCLFRTNAIPNHDFNDGGQAFANDVSAQNDSFEITTSPSFASHNTALSLGTDNAILLNGVKVDLLAAGCFGIGNGKVGCNDDDQPWRFDPMFAPNGFRVDSHNAHAQPDGTYHYHGTPNAFYHADNNGNESPVVGFAADGFPIFGPYFDDQGTVRKAQPSYQLKSGSRPSGQGNPGGNYDGSYRDDYEYVPGSGDLDECNGMSKNGVYGYYITDNYPYILACFKGTPDPSFNK